MWTYEEFSYWLSPTDALFGRGGPWAAPLSTLRWRETPDAYYLEGSLPGFRKKDLSIEARGRVIAIQAERDRGLWRPEHHSFREVVTLPEGADPTGIDASFSHGELSIRIAKAPHAQRRSVPVRVNGRLPPATIDATASTPARPTWLPVPLVEKITGALRWFGDNVRALFGAQKST